MFDPDLLADETILITGGGSGLGRAMAERFAGLGAAIAVVGRRPEPLDETVAAIAAAGGRATSKAADVRDPASLEAAIAASEDDLGPITALVNNAAGNFLAPSEELSPNAFDAVVRIVLHGTFHATQAMGRRWIERGAGGRMLAITTTYAWMGSPFVLPSACAKAGVQALVRSLAVEWAEHGIRCNAIAPGPFPTEGAFTRLMPPEIIEAAKTANPLGRFGDPAELADLAAFLLSPMAGYMNGEVVVLDGGEWLATGQEFGRYAKIPREQRNAMMRKLKPQK